MTKDELQNYLENSCEQFFVHSTPAENMKSIFEQGFKITGRSAWRIVEKGKVKMRAGTINAVDYNYYQNVYGDYDDADTDGKIFFRIPKRIYEVPKNWHDKQQEMFSVLKVDAPPLLRGNRVTHIVPKEYIFAMLEHDGRVTLNSNCIMSDFGGFCDKQVALLND